MILAILLVSTANLAMLVGFAIAAAYRSIKMRAMLSHTKALAQIMAAQGGNAGQQFTAAFPPPPPPRSSGRRRRRRPPGAVMPTPPAGEPPT